MASRRDRGSPVLEWTRMTSRQQSPYFVPRPTPGCSSAYDTEKIRRKVPVPCMDKSPGREWAQKVPIDPPSTSKGDATNISACKHRYGASESEIRAKLEAERRKKFAREREEYLLSQGKMGKVAGVCDLSKGTGRDSPVLWQARPAESPDISDCEEAGPKQLGNTSKGFTISKAPRFMDRNRRSPTEIPLLKPLRNEPASSGGLTATAHNEFGTFGCSPARPEIKPDNRADLDVNFEAVRGSLARNISFGAYAPRKQGAEEKPSVKYLQLFKKLQRPLEPTQRLRASRGMSTMLSPSRGDLPSILKHADNDRLRAKSALDMNETSPHVKEILYSNESQM